MAEGLRGPQNPIKGWRTRVSEGTGRAEMLMDLGNMKTWKPKLELLAHVTEVEIGICLIGVTME